jgi:hypothetical protein
MSRSYKKHVWFKDHNKGAKREANQKVRRTPEIANGKAYRKVYDPWNICDWKWLYDPKPYWSEWQQKWIDPTPLWKARKK